MQLHVTPVQLRTILWQSMVAIALVAVGGLLVRHWLPMIWLLLGSGIGMALWWLDELVGIAYYRRNEQDTELITRSPLFILVFAVLAVFVVTSTDQHIGFGVIWGLSACLLIEGWQYAAKPAEFTQRFLGMLTKNSTVELTQVQTIQIAAGATAGIIVLLCLWVLRLT